MKKKGLLRAISVGLCACLLTAMFSGCGYNATGVEGESTLVAYNTEGKFTTTLTNQDASFAKDLSTADLSVTYAVIDEEAYTKALEKEGDVEESKVNPSDYEIEVNPAVDSVRVQDAHTLVITFTDPKAAENMPYAYDIVVKKGKTGLGKMLGASAQVAYPEYTVRANVENVSVFDKDIRLTLELNEGSFTDNVSREAITLGGAFEKMNIASLSASGKNLTIQLTGAMCKDDSSNAYLNGVISIGKSGIKNGYTTASVQIPVETVSLGFALEKMAVSKGQMTVPMQISGYHFSNKTVASSFTVEGAKVTGFQKTGDSTGVLTMSVNGAKDKAGMAKALDGKKIKIAASAIGSDKDVSFEADFGDAVFYPVFDYAEEANGTYTMTLMLYANSGKFADSLTTDMVSFADGFQNASALSIERQSDTVAELKLTVPSSGAPVEKMNINGTVNLKTGALVNRWGGAADKAVYTRNYQQSGMGKDFSADDVNTIKNIVGGFGNTTMGTIFGVASGIASAGSAVLPALELLGFVESENAKLDKIYGAIQDLNNQVSEIKALIDDQNARAVSSRVSDFYQDKLPMLTSSRSLAVAMIQSAKDILEKQGVAEPAMLTYDSDGRCTSPQRVQDEWDSYMQKVMQEAKKIDSNQGVFLSLLREFRAVCAAVANVGAGINNILDDYDLHMTYFYNFDTTGYKDRENFRLNILFQLLQSAVLLSSYNRYGTSYPAMAMIQEISDQYQNAKKSMDSKTVVRRNDGKVYVYVLNKTLGKFLRHDSRLKSAITNGTNFNNTQINNFVKRMNGRNLGNELLLAGVDYGRHMRIKGIAFSAWKTNTGSWYWKKCRHYTEYKTNYFQTFSRDATWDYIYDSEENGTGKLLDYWLIG